MDVSPDSDDYDQLYYFIWENLVMTLMLKRARHDFNEGVLGEGNTFHGVYLGERNERISVPFFGQPTSLFYFNCYASLATGFGTNSSELIHSGRCSSDVVEVIDGVMDDGSASK